MEGDVLYFSFGIGHSKFQFPAKKFHEDQEKCDFQKFFVFLIIF